MSGERARDAAGELVPQESEQPLAPETSRAAQPSERLWVEALDSEQRGFAQHLHDTLAQSLNAACVFARVTRETVRRSCPDASTSLVTLEEVIQTAANDLQSLARWLRPARLDGSDLPTTLAELCQLACQTVPCELRCSSTPIDADTEQQAELLRAAQLALHALLRRARVARLQVELELDEQQLVLSLRAAGGQPLPHEIVGLLGARARAFGGDFGVQQDHEHRRTLRYRLPKRR